LEWVDRHDGGAATTIAAPNSSSSVRAPRVTKKKGGGYLRHCAQSLKRIARLSDKDRQEVLRALRKKVKKRRVMSEESNVKASPVDESSLCDTFSSVNNGWENWLILHGNKKVVSDDVCGIGKLMGLDFKGVCCLEQVEKI
jgi:hypothetical protein